MRNWEFGHVDFSAYPSYEGDDLGVRLCNTGVRVKIWAPGAQEVRFMVYRQSLGGKPVRISYLVPEQDGCWSLFLDGNFRGLYYTFIVVYDGQPMNETPGVDARAVGINGKRGLFFDPMETNPEGWEADRPLLPDSPVDAVIYELHVRDFSIDPRSGMTHKGQFLAFTELGTKGPGGLASGIDHLRELGITHVHLLPVADFFTVDERQPGAKYNWGYDPLNYNAPEGSYSTNPDTVARIVELKKLVMALHHAGIGVILDVVYNHTGFTRRSWFNQTVPGYYYRQESDGRFANASGCGNEIASERAMVRKYIVDSVCYWAEEFHLDGFRFDLMGVLDIETMNTISRKLKKINDSIILYGEGWTAGPSPLDKKYRAVKSNVARLEGMACFNDDIRDALKGNVFDGGDNGFVSGKVLREEAVKFGIVAACFHPDIVYDYVGSSHYAWAKEPLQSVTYVSSHDNFTLFDKLKISRPDATEADIIRMHKLAAAIVLTSQGIPFLHGGMEFCRTKNGEYNSYRAADSVNMIDWSRKLEYNNVFEYFRALIAFRRDVPALRMRSAAYMRRYLRFTAGYRPGVISYVIRDYPEEKRWKTMQLIFNASPTPIDVTLSERGKWMVIAEDDTIRTEGVRSIDGDIVSVSAISMTVLVKR